MPNLWSREFHPPRTRRRRRPAGKAAFRARARPFRQIAYSRRRLHGSRQRHPRHRRPPHRRANRGRRRPLANPIRECSRRQTKRIRMPILLQKGVGENGGGQGGKRANGKNANSAKKESFLGEKKNVIQMLRTIFKAR